MILGSEEPDRYVLIGNHRYNNQIECQLLGIS